MAILQELSLRKIALVVGGLATLAGAAYYYLVYQPQAEQASAVVAHQAVKPPAGARPAQPRVAQIPLAASGVPAASGAAAPLPVAVSQAQPAMTRPKEVTVIAAAASVPAVDVATAPVKTKPAAKKSVPKKPRVKRPPAQPASVESGPEVAASSQQLTMPMPAVLPESGVISEPIGETRIETPKYNDMLTAVLRSDKDAVMHLLAMGRWVDKPGPSGLTPLMAAVMNRDAQMVQLLLQHGADPSGQALKLARKNKDPASVSLLEQHGAR